MSARSRPQSTSHNGNDSASATSSRRGLAHHGESLGERFDERCDGARELRRQHRLDPEGAAGPAVRDGRPARKDTRARRRGDGGDQPPSLTRAIWAGSPDTTPGAAVNTNSANSSSTVTRSSSRSRMIVANAAVALSRSRRASRYGRMTSPARAGSRKLAAKPMTVVRNAVAKCVGPIGASRYCQRSARRAYVSPVVPSARREIQRARRGGFRPRPRTCRRCAGKRPASRASAGKSGRYELVAALRGRSGIRIRIQGPAANRIYGETARRPPFTCKLYHRSAPSLWENASYCSSSGSWSWGRWSTRPPPPSAKSRRPQLLDLPDHRSRPARGARQGIRRRADQDRDLRGVRGHDRASRLRRSAAELTITGEDRPMSRMELRSGRTATTTPRRRSSRTRPSCMVERGGREGQRFGRIP